MFPCQPSSSRRNLLTVCGVVAAVSLGVTARHQAQGDERGETLDMLRSVATLRERGEYSKAIATAKAAVARAKTTVGPDAPQTTAAKQALGSAYLEVGDRAAAEPLLRDTLASVERAQPQDMRAVCNVVGDLAQAVTNQAEAESLHRRALAIAEEAYGPEHPATAMALNNIGAWYREQARPEEAEPLMRRALRIRERTEGTGSPLAAQSLCSLGMIAADRGEMSLAEALESYTKAFGPSHLRTLLVMHTKGDALFVLGRHTESERVHQDLIATLETLPQPRAEALAEALREFAQHLVEAGKPRQAIDFCRRAIALRRQSHGQDDGPLVAMRGVLAEALYADAKPDQAVSEGRAILAWMQDNPETQPLDAAAIRHSLAKYLLAVGEMEEARRLLREAVAMFEQTTGQGSRQTLNAMHLLAFTYLVTDDLGEAERLLDDGLQRFAAADDRRSGDVAMTFIALLGKIYRSTGRIDKAEKAEAAVRQAHAGPSR